eukprot:TRINITY_DN4485_c0_g1_i2.p1 TRINITY_DN4485_c0_g1~~TRINITY_DN4485_c0_g1_i2.p1  ORF type:complete len:689 (+),score=169.44 TRINITY_DN4485_c0_g1_i2:61-2127(+)
MVSAAQLHPKPQQWAASAPSQPQHDALLKADRKAEPERARWGQFGRGVVEGLAVSALLLLFVSTAATPHTRRRGQERAPPSQAPPQPPPPPPARAPPSQPPPARAPTPTRPPRPPPRGGRVDVRSTEEPDERMPQWMKDMWKERGAARIDDGAFIDADVPPELRHVARGNQSYLFVTFGTASVSDFVWNWLAHLRRLGLGPYFVGALDERMRDACRERGVPTMLLSGNTILRKRGAKFIQQGDGSFKKMGSVKTKFVQDLLDLGISPILTDADVAWLRDPRPYFDRGSYRTADVLISGDCIDIPADKLDNRGCAHVNFNTGVLLLRATPATRTFVESWKTKVRTSNIAWMRDQPAFNLLARLGPQGGLGRVNAEPGRAVYLSGNATIRMGVLPVWLFSNGHTYFVQNHHRHHPEDGRPYSVHMTYQYGDAGEYAYGKRERMRQHGLWLVDSDAYYGGRFLSVADDGAQAAFGGPEEVGWGPRDYLTAIERHLEEDRLRRLTIRNAFAVAAALNRTLVLPAPRCYCDRIWNNLNGCRAPGSERFHLPYYCPLDHIFDLPKMYAAKLQFRAPSFLDDPRLPRGAFENRARVSVRPHSGRGQPREADAQLSGPFNDREVAERLAPFADRRVLELSSLGPGTFCGHADADRARAFDAAMAGALTSHAYYCLTEPWVDMGRPMGNPWEPLRMR